MELSEGTLFVVLKCESWNPRLEAEKLPISHGGEMCAGRINCLSKIIIVGSESHDGLGDRPGNAFCSRGTKCHYQIGAGGDRRCHIGMATRPSSQTVNTVWVYLFLAESV